MLIAFHYSFQRTFAQARARNINAERIDASLALVLGRVERNCEVSFPAIRRFHASVQIPRCFHPFDFIGAVAGGKNGFHFDGDRLGFGALKGRVSAIVVADKCLSRAAACDLRVYAINRFSL